MKNQPIQQDLLMNEYTDRQLKIEGLTYIPNFITKIQESELYQIINNKKWSSDLSRRVQHYGYRYDYKKRSVDAEMKVGPLPDWLEEYARRLYNEKYFNVIPDQVIINEYKPGQGIASHIDCAPCFTNTIASLSLGSFCVMDLTHEQTNRKKSILLESCSLLILSGQARYKWKHGIPSRKSDMHMGIRYSRGRRISLTFRKVRV